MRLRRKFAWLALPAALALVSAGCAGINTSQTISPASFFLPGLLRADPPAATNTLAMASNLSHQLTQAR